ncbi:MAG: hypothetical protein Q9192_003934 [Flavoplaca navasiana]
MFVKLPTIVLVAVTATLSLGAPTPEGDGLSLREANPQIEGNIELLSGAEAIAVRSEEERQLERRTSKCAWKNCHIHAPYVRIEYPGGRCGCAPQGHIPPGAKIAHRTLDLTSSEELQERDVQTAEAIGLDLTNQTPQIDCQKRLGCPPWGHPEKRHNRCLCINNKKAMLERDVQADQASQIDQTAQVEQGEQVDCEKRLKCPPWGHPEKRHNRCLCINNKKAVLERDVQADQASQINQTAQVEQGEQVDCEKRLKCPPWGHPEKRYNRCFCINNKKAMLERDVQTDQALQAEQGEQIDQTAQVEQGAQVDCEKRLKCPPWGHPEKRHGRCFCINNKPKMRLERDTSSLEQRSTPKLQLRNPQYDMPTGDEPLDCASIAKCPGGQHPVNNASDGMCECVDDDTPDTGMPDCASIAKCPGDQQAVFNNSLGMCQCIPLNTQLDCDTIAKCADGAHPMNYMGNCICVPDVA